MRLAFATQFSSLKVEWMCFRLGSATVTFSTPLVGFDCLIYSHFASSGGTIFYEKALGTLIGCCEAKYFVQSHIDCRRGLSE